MDLGANVKLLPFTVHGRLRLDELRPTKIVLQSVVRSTRLLWDVVEDVLIKVGEFFLINFVVLDIVRVANGESHFLTTLGAVYYVSNALLAI